MRSCVRDLQRAVQLVGRHAVLVGAHHMDRHEPLVDRDFGPLEDGADQHGELLTARCALVDAPLRGVAGPGVAVGRAGLEEVGAVAAAMGADGMTRPAQLFEEEVRLVLIREVPGDVIEGDLLALRVCLRHENDSVLDLIYHHFTSSGWVCQVYNHDSGHRGCLHTAIPIVSIVPLGRSVRAAPASECWERRPAPRGYSSPRVPGEAPCPPAA